MISVENLTVRFGAGPPAVDGVSFHVAPGEMLGLVGESGCGKSTVLRVLSGLNRVWDGRVVIDGQAVAPVRSQAFHRNVQMVFQDPYGSLHPRHTVNTVLTEPLSIHGIGDAAARVAAVLLQVGLGPAFRYRYPHQLSGGQRQRLAIARALILEPKVLLLDEPTSALDVSVQAEILNLLSRLRRERNLTYLFVSHDLAVIDHMCDRLLVMKGGQAVEELAEGALSHLQVESDYTRALMKASEGFVRPDAA